MSSGSDDGSLHLKKNTKERLVRDDENNKTGLSGALVDHIKCLEDWPLV
jgi:hypothetical protein